MDQRKETAEVISAKSTLSTREAEVVIAVTEEKNRETPPSAYGETDQEVFERVAEQLDVQPTTVQTHYHRAKQKAEKATHTDWFVHSPRAYIHEQRGHGVFDAPLEDPIWHES